MDSFSALASNRDACRAWTANDDHNYEPTVHMYLLNRTYSSSVGDAALRNIMTMVLRAFCNSVGLTQRVKTRAQASSRFEAGLNGRTHYGARGSKSLMIETEGFH